MTAKPISSPAGRPGTALFLLTLLVPSLVSAALSWSNALRPVADYARLVKDFTPLWVSARLASAGHIQDVSDLGRFQAAIAQDFPAATNFYTWFYPPHVYLLTAPFAALPYPFGFAAWTILTLTALAVMLQVCGQRRHGWVLLSPAVIENAIAGQNGALTTAAMLGALTLTSRSPRLAGLALSLLTLKPQMSIAVPVCLLASRQWRAIAWGIVFAALWAGATAAWFGPAVWLDYVRIVVPRAAAYFLQQETVPFGELRLQVMMTTPFALVRSLGGGGGLGQVVNLGVAVLVLVAAARLWWPRSPAPAPLKLAFALAAVPLVTPYALTYDMIGPSLACLILLSQQPVSRLSVYVAGLAWIWPGVATYTHAATGQAGLGACIYAALAAIIWTQAMRHDPRQTSVEFPR